MAHRIRFIRIAIVAISPAIGLNFCIFSVLASVCWILYSQHRVGLDAAPAEQHRDNTSKERCQVIKLDSYVLSKAATHEYTFTLAYTKSRAILQTWGWMGNENGTSFLDLPRELRDMIYVYVCNDMKHEGNGWRKKGEYSEDSHTSDYQQHTIQFQNCDIMRTCRQVHWEFAKVLYSRPLQLSGVTSYTHSQIVVTGSHILPLSAAYAHLVRKLAVIHSIDLQDYHGQGYAPEQLTSAICQWQDIVTATARIVKLFPSLEVVRVLHQISTWGGHNDQTLKTMYGLCDATREQQIGTAVHFLKTARWSNFRKIKIPLQLELLHIDDGTIVETPWAEALRIVQAEKLHKRGT